MKGALAPGVPEDGRDTNEVAEDVQAGMAIEKQGKTISWTSVEEDGQEMFHAKQRSPGPPEASLRAHIKVEQETRGRLLQPPR